MHFWPDLIGVTPGELFHHPFVPATHMYARITKRRINNNKKTMGNLYISVHIVLSVSHIQVLYNCLKSGTHKHIQRETNLWHNNTLINRPIKNIPIQAKHNETHTNINTHTGSHANTTHSYDCTYSYVRFLLSFSFQVFSAAGCRHKTFKAFYLSMSQIQKCLFQLHAI